MSNIEYEFYDGAYNTEVDRQKNKVIMHERGGWSRDYSLTFTELTHYAEQWDVFLDLNLDDRNVAEVATKIMLANHSAEHGLDPFRYVSRTNKITEPKDVDTISKFEKLLDKYTLEQVAALLSDETKNKLQKLLIQK